MGRSGTSPAGDSSPNSLSLSEERVRERFHARITLRNLAKSLALNLTGAIGIAPTSLRRLVVVI
jgi:hypothetical protein